MVIYASEREQVLTANMRGGDGTVDKRDYKMAEMPPHGKMFAEIRLEPGCSIGTHGHTGEYETFFIHEGEVVVNDNGEEKVLHPGDFAICRSGELHGIANRSDKTAAVYAVIIRTED